MKTRIFTTILFIFFTLSITNTVLAAGRLNFMLTNLTDVNIKSVRIAPSYYTNYISDNLIKTSLDSNTRIYIGPNYYGDQKYWDIFVEWDNGYSHVFTKSRLTSYNSYTVYANNYGVHMLQGYERAFARYSQNSVLTTYTSPGNPEFQIAVGVPEKVNRANVAKAPTPEVAYVASNAQRKTRDLVFEDDEDATPATEGTAAAKTDGEAISVKATVELTRDGKLSTVLPSSDFKSGDKVRLIFSTSRDGYVYWVAKGTSGTYQVLYPNPKVGMDNSVVKNREYTVPAKGSWKFDENKGAEVLVCFLSPNKISNLDSAVQLATDGDTQGASKLIATIADDHENKRTTRDLVFEEEDNADVNTKTQKSQDDDIFVATYDLMHN